MDGQDHDLLIELKVKVDSLITETKEMKNADISNSAKTEQRMTHLENNSLPRREAERILMDTKKEANGVHDDHEKRIRRLERNMWVGIGGLAVFQVVLNIALALYLHNS